MSDQRDTRGCSFPLVGPYSRRNLTVVIAASNRLHSRAVESPDTPHGAYLRSCAESFLARADNPAVPHVNSLIAADRYRSRMRPVSL